MTNSAKPTRPAPPAQATKRDHHKQRIYRTFRPSTLKNEYRNLSRPGPSGQWLAVMLHAGTETARIPGVIETGRLAMAELLRWTPDDFDRCFRELTDHNLAIADWDARLVFMPHVLMVEEAAPHSFSALTTMRRAFDELPVCDLRATIDQHIRELLALYRGPEWVRRWDGDESPLTDRHTPPSPNAKKRSEKHERKLVGLPARLPARQPAGLPGGLQKQDQDQDRKSGRPARARERSSVPVEGIQNEEHEERAVNGATPPPPDVDPINELVADYGVFQHQHNLPPLEVGAGLRAQIAAADIDPQHFRAVLDRASRSDLLTGRVPGSRWHGQGVSLLWLLNAENRAKVLAGDYDRRPARVAPHHPRLVSSRPQPPAADAPLDVWAELCERMVGRTNRYNINQWLRPCRLTTDTASGVHVEAPDDGVLAWVERHRADLEELLAELRPGVPLTVSVKGQAAALAS